MSDKFAPPVTKQDTPHIFLLSRDTPDYFFQHGEKKKGKQNSFSKSLENV